MFLIVKRNLPVKMRYFGVFSGNCLYPDFCIRQREQAQDKCQVFELRSNEENAKTSASDIKDGRKQGRSFQ